MHKIGGTQVDSFTWAYISALFWTTSEDEFPEYCYSGEFSISEDDAMLLSPDTLFQIIEDCSKFQEDNELLLNEAGGSSQNGHDFALTRNKHGSGFWDREYDKSVSDELTELSHGFGEFNLYKGDDGQIYGREVNQ